MKKIEYITLTGKSTPITNNDIVKFNCATAIIKNRDTGLYLALEFIREEFGLVGGKLEDGENKEDAIIREVEEETGYNNSIIKDVIFEEIFSRGYKARKDREEEALDKVFFVEVEEKNKTEVLGADIGTKGIFWFNEKEMLEKLTLTHHIYFFEEYLNKK